MTETRALGTGPDPDRGTPVAPPAPRGTEPLPQPLLRLRQYEQSIDLRLHAILHTVERPQRLLG